MTNGSERHLQRNLHYVRYEEETGLRDGRSEQVQEVQCWDLGQVGFHGGASWTGMGYERKGFGIAKVRYHGSANNEKKKRKKKPGKKDMEDHLERERLWTEMVWNLGRMVLGLSSGNSRRIILDRKGHGRKAFLELGNWR